MPCVTCNVVMIDYGGLVIKSDVVMITIMFTDEQGRHAGKNRNPDHGRYEQVSLLFHLHKKMSTEWVIILLLYISLS